MGIQFASIKNFKSKDWLDIENTLHEASLEIPNDSSLFSLLCSWVSVHGDYVIIEKLMKLQKKNNSPWLIAIAICASNLGFHQWKRLIKKQPREFALVDKDLAMSAIAIKGEEPCFRKSGFLNPKRQPSNKSLRCKNNRSLGKKESPVS